MAILSNQFEKKKVFRKYYSHGFLCHDKEGNVVTYFDFGNLDLKGFWNSAKPLDGSKTILLYLQQDLMQLELQNKKTIFSIKMNSLLIAPVFGLLYGGKEISFHAQDFFKPTLLRATLARSRNHNGTKFGMDTNDDMRNLFIYLSNTRVWLLDHLTPSLPIPTKEVVRCVLIESSALDQVVILHSGLAVEWAALFSSQAKPVEVNIQKVMSGG
ncbi:uncharacterized protein TNCV_4558861 [Trichonephila clavipes]|nr:uncharacterized protein TNCV_4558861 [Trichonephila clavipes]